MTEKEMEDLIWTAPERFLVGEELTRVGRQVPLETGIADLVFQHALGYLLVVELKRGVLPREALPQVVKYFAAAKRRWEGQAVEKLVIANQIPPERKAVLERQGVSALEIPELKFRRVAEELGYHFCSEEDVRVDPACPVRHGQIIGGDYPPCEGMDDGYYDGVVTRVGKKQIEVTFYYTNGKTEDCVLERDSAGSWWDVTYKSERTVAPVTVVWLPPLEHLKEVQRRLDRLGVDYWEGQPGG